MGMNCVVLELTRFLHRQTHCLRLHQYPYSKTRLWFLSKPQMLPMSVSRVWCL